MFGVPKIGASYIQTRAHVVSSTAWLLKLAREGFAAVRATGSSRSGLHVITASGAEVTVARCAVVVVCRKITADQVGQHTSVPSFV